MIIARAEEEKNIIEKMIPIYAVETDFVISTEDSIYLKKFFTSFATSKMTYAPDYYVEERIAHKLVRMKLDINGLNHIGYYRIMDSTLEEIALYNLNNPQLISLQMGKKHGLYDRQHNLVETGIMRSFEVPKYNENIGDSYKYIGKYLSPEKTYGFFNASESAVNPKNNIVAIFEITQKHEKC